MALQDDTFQLAYQFGRAMAQGEKLWLFLDYDGTLAEFAPTPDDILPDDELIALMNRLARFPEVLRVVILSGRRLNHILKLLPVKGILAAGTYGIEMMNWDGQRVNLLDSERHRSSLDQLKDYWRDLLQDKQGFYLEDKGFALAIHGKDAAEPDVRWVFANAAPIARQVMNPQDFQVTQSGNLLEIAPVIANKGYTVNSLLVQFGWMGEGIVFIGDDEKDEYAFRAVKDHNGTPILVSAKERPTQAQYRLENPAAVRRWLEVLVSPLEAM